MKLRKNLFDRFTTNKNEQMGLGEALSKVSKAIGIKPCDGCKKRANRLDEFFKIPISKQ